MPRQVDRVVNKTRRRRRRRSSLLTTPMRQSTSRGCLLQVGQLQPSNSITTIRCGFVVQRVSTVGDISTDSASCGPSASVCRSRRPRLCGPKRLPRARLASLRGVLASLCGTQSTIRGLITNSIDSNQRLNYECIAAGPGIMRRFVQLMSKRTIRILDEGGFTMAA